MSDNIEEMHRDTQEALTKLTEVAESLINIPIGIIDAELEKLPRDKLVHMWSLILVIHKACELDERE
jgi:hypothetical protein